MDCFIIRGALDRKELDSNRLLPLSPLCSHNTLSKNKFNTNMFVYWEKKNTRQYVKSDACVCERRVF
jgi:hypothetical protein